MVWPLGEMRYALTWFCGSLASATSTSMLRSMTGRFDGTTKEYDSTCPSPGERPLPPVSTPLNVPVTPRPVFTSPRSVTGTLTASPALDSTSEPLESPDPAAALAVTCTVPDAPGASVSEAGDTVPKVVRCAVVAPNCTGPAVPPSLAVLLKITAVQVPAAGRSPWVLPYPPTPWGRECPASLPDGLTRMTLTRAFRLEDWAELAGQAIDAFSRACPAGTVNCTVP